MNIIFSLYENRVQVVLSIIIASLTSSCNPNSIPFFKEKSQRMDQETTVKTVETVAASGELKRLDVVCSDLPEISKMKVIKKSLSQRNSNKLFYYYFTENNLTEIKNADILYLYKNGWTINDSYEDSEAYKLEFRKDKYKIKIDYGNYDGSGESNYVTNCEELRE